MIMSEINLTPEELESMLDRAAKRGAKQALSSIGLHDATAAKDINEMRDLLDVWRDTRRGIWSTVVKVTTIAILTFIAGAVWMQLGNK
jgi:2-iminoacetate synthase ThiH